MTRRERYRLLARLGDVASTVGWSRALWIAPLWAICRRYYAIAAPLEEIASAGSDPTEALAGREVEVAELDPDSLKDLLEVNPVASLREARLRLEEGHHCYLWRSAGVPVHYRWVATGRARLPLRRLWLVPAPSDYISLEVCTRPGYRGSGLASVAWSSRHARQLGRTRKIGFVAWWNSPSLRAACRSGGYRVVGALTQWRIGPLCRNLVSGDLVLDGAEVSFAAGPASPLRNSAPRG